VPDERQASHPGDGARRVEPAACRTSVVVPFRDGAVLLARCLASLLDRPTPAGFEVVLVDNGSVRADTAALVARWTRDPRVRLVAAPGPFNFSALVDAGAAAAAGDVLCLLNSDVEALDDAWLPALLAQALRPEVGAVGARLLYPDGSIQHAGIAVGARGAFHVAQFARPDAVAALAVVRDVTAVTGACLATRREVFERLGGFDVALPVAYNDVDYCLRVAAAGLRVVWTPEATLRHHEGASRGRADADAAALALMRARWGARMREDEAPFAHPTVEEAAARRRDGLARAVAALARARPDAAPRIAFVSGPPVAVPGSANRYWIRLLNGGTAPATVRLSVEGAIGAHGRIGAVAEFRLPPGAATDVGCETDWVATATLGAPVPPAGAPCRPRRGARCELVVAIAGGGASDRARLVQDVAE